MSSLVSICIPAYKAEKYLRETLESVKSQTYTDWEIIVTEDGSRDSTQQIVEEFAATVPQQVRYTRHDPNRGLSATRNAGFEYASGRFIALLDSDDLWLPFHLEQCVALLDSGAAELAFGGCRLFDSDTNETIELRVPPENARADFPALVHGGELIIQPSAVVFERSILKNVGGFNSSFPICNDLEFWLRSAKSGVRFAYTGGVTCDYRKHESALSKSGAALVTEVAEIHALYRDWDAIPRADRKRRMNEHFQSAFRMNIRKQPLRALSLYARGTWLKLSI